MKCPLFAMRFRWGRIARSSSMTKRSTRPILRLRRACSRRCLPKSSPTSSWVAISQAILRVRKRCRALLRSWDFRRSVGSRASRLKETLHSPITSLPMALSKCRLGCQHCSLPSRDWLSHVIRPCATSCSRRKNRSTRKILLCLVSRLIRLVLPSRKRA